MIKTIVFDCSDTLLRFTALDELNKIVGDASRAAEIKAKIHQSSAWHLYDKGLISEEGMKQAILPLFVESERSFAAWYMDNWSKCYSPIPGMYELISELKGKGWPLYIISDFPPRFPELKERFADLFCQFSGIAVSYECHLTKRDKSLFSHFLQEFHFNATDCVFIDDYPPNPERARSLGFYGIVFENAQVLREQLAELSIL